MFKLNRDAEKNRVQQNTVNKESKRSLQYSKTS